MRSTQFVSGLLPVAAGLLLSATAASAQTLVGFEGSTPFANVAGSGLLPAVTIARLGDTGAVDTSFGFASTEGSSYAVLTTFSDGGGTYPEGAPLFGGSGAAAGAATLWNAMFAGSSTNQLSAAGVVSGSYISFTLTLTAGNKVGFDYRYLTSEFGSADFAFVGVRSGSTGNPAVFTELTPSSASLTAAPLDVLNFDLASGWASYSFTASSTASYTIVIGVGDKTTEGIQSGLLIDNFGLVPEPGTWAALSGAAALGVALLRRRRSA